MPFPEILLALRLSNGLSQQQLADRANVAEITIQNYESGRSNPVPTRLLAIADVLGVSLDTLVGRDENAFSPPDFDPLTEQVKSLSALQRADVMKSSNSSNRAPDARLRWTTLYKGKSGALSASSPSGKEIPVRTYKRSCGRFCAN